MFYRVFLLVFILPALALSYTVVRSDGRTFSGELILQNPNETILKDEDGVTLRFKSSQIDWNQTTMQIRNDKAQASRIVAPRQSFEYRKVSSQEHEWTGEPFSFDFKDIDIKDLFRFIADISGLNVILDPGIRGTVTLKLTEVPWDQALDLITRNQGLGYTVEGNVIRIAPLSKIERERADRIRLDEQQMLNAPLMTKMIRLSYAKATEMEPIIRKFLTSKGSTIVDRRTNTLIVTDVETNTALWVSTFGL